MEKIVRHVGVFTSGNDASGMNATIRAVVRTFLYMGIRRVGIRRGYHGLINGDFTKLTFESASNLSRRGDTMLYSTCSEEFKTPASQEGAVATYKILGLGTLVSIGGDGTFSGLPYLAKRGLSVMGIPGTIDNDIACSSYTIGYGTAYNTALESIDKLQDAVQSRERCSVVKVMGHRASYLAPTVDVACGATAVIVPEHPVDYEADLLEPIRRVRLAGRARFMIIVAEDIESGAYSIGKVVEEATALDTRVTVLEHIQRGNSPSSRNRITATYMGYETVRLLAKGETYRMVTLHRENYVDYDITETLQMTRSLDQHTYEVICALTGVR